MDPTVRYVAADSDLLIFDICTGEVQEAPSAYREVCGQVSLASCPAPEPAIREVEPAEDQDFGWDEIIFAQMFMGDTEFAELVPGRLA